MLNVDLLAVPGVLLEVGQCQRRGLLLGQHAVGVAQQRLVLQQQVVLLQALVRGVALGRRGQPVLVQPLHPGVVVKRFWGVLFAALEHSLQLQRNGNRN